MNAGGAESLEEALEPLGERSERTVSLAPFAWLGALLAAVAAAGSAGALPRALAAPAAALVLGVGFGLPLLARLAPPAPSWLKLLAFSALLSPCVATALYLALRTRMEAQSATTALFALAAPLALLALGRRASARSPGRGGLVALALALAFGALVAFLTLRGNAPRVSYHGLLHAGIGLAVDRAVPPENPWMAGTELAYYWVWHGAGALVSRALGVAPTVAFALLNVQAAWTLVLALWIALAPLCRDALRELAGVVLAVFGLGALGGLTWLAAGAPYAAPATALELLDAMRALVPGGAEPAHDPRLAFGVSKLFNASSHGVALALAAGGLAAAAHALRHGRRPWPLLCGLLHGAALAANPVLGGVATLATALAAYFFGRGARASWGTIAALVLGAIPGAWLTLAAGTGASLVELDLELARVARGLAPLALLLPGAALAFVPRLAGQPDAHAHADVDADAGGERRALLGLLGMHALVPLALYLFVHLPVENEYKLVRWAAVPLGLLAGAGLVGALRAHGAWRAVALVLAAPLAAGTVANNAHGLRAYAAFAGVDLPLVERELSLAPVPDEDVPPARDLAAAWDFLRREVAPREPDAILVLNPRAAGPPYGPPDARYAFTSPPGTSNIQGHEAPVFAGLSLWCDKPSHLVERHPDLARRLEALDQLYATEETWRSGPIGALQRAERPVVLLLTEADRRRVPRWGLDKKVELLGFVPLYRAGEVRLYGWPVAFARSFAPAAQVWGEGDR